MNVVRILSIAVACIASQFVHAASPTTTTALRVGLIDELKTYCSRVDHPDIGRLEQQIERLLKDMPQKNIAQARHSPEYKTAYETYAAVFNDLPTNLGSQLCQAVISNGGSGVR